MAHKIASVEPESIAAQLDIRAGDELLSINGERIIDFIDYQALTANDELSIVVRRESEGEIEFSFEKEEYEPLGLAFESDMLGAVRCCANRCIFCFVDQLPAHARASLRVKDDDWRLSLLMGNFVTLTNVSDAEFERIVKRRAAPLYISVHATDKTMREFLLGTAHNVDIMPRLKRLKKEGLSFHAQAVICPELNDGDVLRQTISDLAALYPACRSLAIVPVGLTSHREGLVPLRPFARENACDALDIIKDAQKKYLKELGTSFVFGADELYVLSGRNFPSDERYEDYPQIENGVGLCRQLEAEYAFAHKTSDLSRAKKRRIVSACGVSAKTFLERLYREYPVKDIEIEVVAVENAFFGDSVTVSGLVTGNDLVRALQNVQADEILITECMLRDGEDVFLDGMALSEAKKRLPCELTVVERGGEALLAAVLGIPIEDL
ncbi:MAG: DUF512 domain-containing protein [Christensenellales bacterium]|jgi:putative radical SAM enzyme (TIGR03279 family)